MTIQNKLDLLSLAARLSGSVFGSPDLTKVRETYFQLERDITDEPIFAKTKSKDCTEDSAPEPDKVHLQTVVDIIKKSVSEQTVR